MMPREWQVITSEAVPPAKTNDRQNRGGPVTARLPSLQKRANTNAQTVFGNFHYHALMQLSSGPVA